MEFKETVVQFLHKPKLQLVHSTEREYGDQLHKNFLECILIANQFFSVCIRMCRQFFVYSQVAPPTRNTFLYAETLIIAKTMDVIVNYVQLTMLSSALFVMCLSIYCIDVSDSTYVASELNSD